MNGLVIVLIAIAVLLAAYLIYGRWLAKTWGIDPNAKTPAYEKEDGENYIPTPKGVVFSHQFSSIAGAGPVTGPIIAAVFGWVPVFLWLLIGGVFFGAVHDFGALYASVKEKGKSMGALIETYIGRTGRKLFFLFAWIFSLLVIAAFSDMVATAFNGFDASGAQVMPNAAAASISMLFIFVAMAFGVFIKHKKPKQNVQFIIGLVLLIAMLAAGIACPIYLNKSTWLIIVFAYLVFAAILPMWILKQPRDYLTTFLLIGMILGAVIGVVVARPDMNLNAFNGFSVTNAKGQVQFLFPTLFVTIACGAVSGFHSLVSSETSSKQIMNEKDMLPVGYGAMIVETLLGVIALVVVGAASKGGQLAAGAPFDIFAAGVAGFLEKLGLPVNIAECVMKMCVSALALTSLDAVARIGRMSFEEFFMSDTVEGEDKEKSSFIKLMTNKYFSTALTLILGYMLSLGGYNNVWPLFGAANQLLSALVLITLAVFLKSTQRKGFMLWAPMVVMLCVTFTSLGQSLYGIISKLFLGGFNVMTDGLQLIFAILLISLGLLVAVSCFKKLFEKNTAENSQPEPGTEV